MTVAEKWPRGTLTHVQSKHNRDRKYLRPHALLFDNMFIPNPFSPLLLRPGTRELRVCNHLRSRAVNESRGPRGDMAYFGQRRGPKGSFGIYVTLGG